MAFTKVTSTLADTLNQNTTGSAATLTTARTIGGTSFDGSANIAVALSATTTALATARTIGGTSFDGTANIAVGLAGTATALATARTIGGTSFDGTANIAVATATEATNITATANNSADETVYPAFVDGATGTQGLETDTGFTYNPSSGNLTTTGQLGGATLNLSGNATVGGNLTVTGTSTVVDTVTMNAQNAIVFEGATADEYETTLSIVDPTADHTQYLINQGGYIPVLAASTTTAISATPAELNYVDGVTSAIQTQLDAKLPLAGGTLTGNIAHAGNLTFDVGGDIILDAGGTDIILKDDGTEFGRFMTTSTPGALYIQSAISNADMIFNGNDGGGIITAMTIDMSEGGRVGIGTPTPGTNLEVSGHDAAVRITDSTGTAYSYDLKVGQAADGNFAIRDHTAGADRLVIKNTGNVGIGTNTPQSVLDVVGPASRPTSLAEFDTASTARFVSDSSNAQSLYIAEAGDGAILQATDGTANSSTAKQLRLNPFGGQVGIGTDASSIYAPLNVETASGSAYAAGGVNGVGLIMRNRSSTVGTSSGIKWLANTSYHDLGGIHMVLTGNSSTAEQGELTFWTSNSGDSGNTEKMRIDAAGLVGIGTADPAVPLHVDKSGGGNLLQLGGGNVTEYRVFVDSNEVRHQVDHDADEANSLFTWFVDNNRKAMLRDYGLALGSQDVKADLHIKQYGNSWENGILLETDNATTGWNIHSERTNNALYIGYNADTSLALASQTATVKLAIEGAGNVGIGTAEPGTILDIVTSTANTNGVVRIQNNMDNNYEALRIHSLGNFDAQISFLAQGSATYWGAIGIDYSDAGKFKLQTDNLFAGGSTLMTWARDGKVGIGTTGPTAKLEIHGNSDTSDEDVQLRIVDNDTSAGSKIPSLAFFGGGTQQVRMRGSDSGLFISASASNNDDLVVLSGGNVGIGTAAPKAPLHVATEGTDGHAFGGKNISLSTSYHTGAQLAIVLGNHQGCYVKVFITGDYSNHSAIGFVGEYFIKNGSGGYAQPGAIIREVDNTYGTESISSQIVDEPSTDTFQIQFKINASSGTASGKLTYQVMGQFDTLT